MLERLSDGGETVTASGTVDTSVAGTYTITYTATDAAGNTGTATRTVTVVDTTAPVITVTAGTDTVEQGSTWTDAGAISNGGETVTASGTVDINTLGTYTITYTATDAAENVGTVTRTVTVVAPLLNADGTRIEWGNYASPSVGGGENPHPSPIPNSFTAPEGYEIILYVSGSRAEEYNTSTNTITDLLQLLKDSGNIDGKAYAGLWYIGPDRGPNGNWSPWSGSYTWGAYAKLIDIIAPVITVISGDDTVEQGSAWTDAGATADTGEAVTASGTVDTSVVGTYTITYTATDAAGNVGTPATRTVTVVDTTADPYDTWASSFGLNPATVGAPTADPDGDGIQNLLEQAFGGDPNANNINILPVSEILDVSNQSYLQISYRKPELDNGLTYTVETVTDLNGTWSSQSSEFELVSTVPDSGGFNLYTYRLVNPTSATSKAFIRVDISETP